MQIISMINSLILLYMLNEDLKEQFKFIVLFPSYGTLNYFGNYNFFIIILYTYNDNF